MRARGQRTHLMGASNRNHDTYDSNFKTQTVFERSYNKTKSIYCQSIQKTMLADHTISNESDRRNPFLGTHNEFETQRFDKMNVKPYKYKKMVLPPNPMEVTLAPYLNKDIKAIQEEFSNCKINMHKMNELKHTFVKNNRQRRDLKPYFQKYCNAEGKIDTLSLKKIVKQYGFDINEDEAKLIFRLTNRKNPSSANDEELKVDGFVQLMTKDDIFYKTLRIKHPDSTATNQKLQIRHFSDKVHEILRNKFPKLKEAFKIYQMRGEQVNHQRFDFVMKKLDLTDLVITQEERDSIFSKYSENGNLNPEGLICAIAEQEYGLQPKKDKWRDFSQNLDAAGEKDHKIAQKVRGSSLKNMSDLEYEKQLLKAQNIINQLRKIKKQRHESNKETDLFGHLKQEVSREAIARETEDILQKEGVNFQKEDYDAFVAYFDFDTNGVVSKQNINQTIFLQTEKQARNRFERKTRNEAPKKNKNNVENEEASEEVAQESISKLKNHQLNPQNRELFKLFDKDLDGYIAENQFKENLQSLAIMDEWEIKNLTSFLGIDKKGGINFNQFTNKININKPEVQRQLPAVSFRNSKSCYDWGNFAQTKKNFIKTFNQPNHQKPTKFSAWPERLTFSDLSLLQAPPQAGTHASEGERFGERKEEYGMKQKQISQGVMECKRQRIASWNNKLQERVERKRDLEEQRQAARNYSMRLAQEKYQRNCHQ